MDKDKYPTPRQVIERRMRDRGEVERVHFESTPGGNENGLWPSRVWGQPVIVDSGPILDVSNLLRVQEMLSGGFRRGDFIPIMSAMHHPWEDRTDMTMFMAKCSPDPEAFMQRLMGERPLAGLEGFDEEGFKKSLDDLFGKLESGKLPKLFEIDSLSQLGPFEPGDEVTVSYQTIGGKRRKSKKDKNVSKKKKLKASRLAKGLINRI